MHGPKNKVVRLILFLISLMKEAEPGSEISILPIHVVTNP